ncbi:hypothetical protein CaCOL14_012163 [Colletotrichum acutatum]
MKSSLSQAPNLPAVVQNFTLYFSVIRHSLIVMKVRIERHAHVNITVTP